MKTNLITLATLLIVSTSTLAQSDKYLKAMEKNVATYDTARSIPTIQSLMGAFGRIAQAEKTQWLPYYYAGMCATSMANNEPDKARVDGWADQAEAFAQKADSLSPNNSEVSVLLATVHFARINVDFMGRGPKYSALGADALQRALQQNPNNPRAMVVLAQLRNTAPAGFGGDKAVACQLAQKAKAIYETEPQTGIQPTWGRGSAKRLVTMCESK
ncbi:tetratricopeptide repeat protein [Spirosoma montaniterrae]|uniref:Tetratricopeptide repeat protein n=1 Tax=Spirosoma montaniterrae TaxID=1178516 RepID=A0A1P9WTF2_9BACT|nr:hypothetical protein [Spirosoma montaniterrae]AQG78664.1 hypothetical protein AWR27_04530 [Spirosoma montaniterrae]